MTVPSRTGTAVEERRDQRRYRFGDTNTADPRFGADGWSESDLRSDRSRIVLTPIAAPSILGLYGLCAALFPFGTYLAGWWGIRTIPSAILPFALVLGGLAQLIAGVWAYRARDGLGTALHGVWGAFWTTFGIYQLLAAVGTLPPIGFPRHVALGIWFIPLAAITAVCALGALAVSAGLFTVVGSLTAGAVCAAIGWLGGYGRLLTVSGWLFVISAALAWYVASAILLNRTFGRTVLPTGEMRESLDLPDRAPGEPADYDRDGDRPVRTGR